MRKRTPAQEALAEAITCIEGGQAELARRLQRSPQQISNWLNRDNGAPLEVCADIAALVNHKVPCERLRPEIDWDRLRRNIGTPACGTNKAASAATR